MTCGKIWNSCIGARYSVYLCILDDLWSMLFMASKHDSCQMIKFVFCRTNWCLNVININENFTCTNLWNSFIGAQHAVYLRLIFGPKITCTNSRYSCIVARPTAYLCLMGAQNITGAKWWKCICARTAVYVCRIKAPNTTRDYPRKS